MASKKLNDIKLDLLKRQFNNQFVNLEPEQNYSMDVNMRSFCPYFCSDHDLNGKDFRNNHIRKREMMSPFSLRYSSHSMI